MDAAPFGALRPDPGRLRPSEVHRLLVPGRDGGWDEAAATLRRWIATGVLVAHPPALWHYELVAPVATGMGPTVVRGVLAAVRVGDGAVVASEGVDSERLEQRTARLRAVEVDVSPVTALVDDREDALVRAVTEPPPTAVVDHVDERGVRHVLAPLPPDRAAPVVAALTSLRAAIADGHHRWAAAARRAEEGGDQRTLVHLVVPSDAGPRVGALHRLLSGAPEDLVARVEHAGARVRSVPLTADAPDARAAEAAAAMEGVDGRAAVLVGAGRAWLVSDGASGRGAAVDAALVDDVIAPALGAVVSERDPDPALLVEKAWQPDVLAALVRPVPASLVVERALAGEPLPARTTWFWPKPRTGLLLRPLASPPAGGPASAAS